MSIVTKKAEKMAAVEATLPNPFTFDDFLFAFQNLYPKDWQKVVREYQKHEKKIRPGKSHPMPKPEQYIRNAFHVHRSASNSAVKV